ncbi:peptidoglycan binding protein [Amycolatopsis mediterranei S699]|uniref:Peptidoglycan binding protein n=2 Tax=Amycolatopsis mediterranei TaxID=33910 RepID=A0A9R0NWY3_AMYMS|nr:helix-turn-helix domain-containing protein [Amycolatopsis mediterranei]ADJ45404.1 putative peptidoglycan binding protein [Amycolatopsis mediterranei U32]AEK42168.1 peptidoglycan binding protein [Amycolatopsis mediterranei S699]AFO77116.1 peptidoglycan binding protein [Amycolatopsis mediterranei S699]AGT84244.1 peptidoglycan binding protein [Amycolatopsis mediterranei RB]KDO05982.1 peptidoglycan-binding protein [Amycolatopsis mediterranei]
MTLHTDKFAAYLRMLKDRSGQGYERLGKQAGASGSSLHRYCSGKSVPADYRVVHSFGKVCGASPAELRELHQLWALADAGRVDEAEQTGTGEDEDAAPPRRRRAYAATAIAVVGLLAAGLVWLTADASAPATGRYADRMLFSPGCQPPVSMGQHDECVTEVQNLLVAAHGRLSVDGSFGPETLRRVTAFQVLAGLPARGVVDEATKTALYDHRASMATWSAAMVEQRVRAVFTEAPDTAVAIARCASFLDPLWVLPNTNGSRNWGVFQISDARLLELGGSPRQAFDPGWNIDAAHRLWSVRHDFHDWPACSAALTSPPSH